LNCLLKIVLKLCPEC